MNILRLIVDNAKRNPSTRRFPVRQIPAEGFRGSVVIDPDRCLACGVCAHVCVSAAIELVSSEIQCDWTYDPARCTFCGLCVRHCPVGALSQVADRGPSCGLSGELAEKATITYPPCPECGRPAMPFSEELLAVAFTDVSAELRERAHLCERCRQKATVRAMKKGFGALGETERNNDGR